MLQFLEFLQAYSGAFTFLATLQRFLCALSHHKNSYEWFMYPMASSCVTADMPLFIA
jgi:hypothetical protein